jgi:hypothetical protein
LSFPPVSLIEAPEFLLGVCGFSSLRWRRERFGISSRSVLLLLSLPVTQLNAPHKLVVAEKANDICARPIVNQKRKSLFFYFEKIKQQEINLNYFF